MTTALPAADLARTARLFHALSDETRLRIVAMLQQGERCVCELTGALDAAQSRLSFHLKTLKDAGLVTDRRAGRWVYYALAPAALEEIAATAQALMPSPEAWSSSGGCCG
ncbi:MAG: winged helix-turn-helix transcriptional regulator [Gemmatimonadetes bacterium]|nr:winged helix-turn-helix transcriptional regulator [Gemmatimonadota bacterium]